MRTILLTCLLSVTLLRAGEAPAVVPPPPVDPKAPAPAAPADPKVDPKADPKAAPNPAAPAAVAPPAAEVPWQKIELKHVALPSPRAILSPGFFDNEIQNIITFDKKNECADIGLPPAKGAKGPLKAKQMQKFVWIDFNGDGKPSGDETKPVGDDGWTETYSYDAAYEGGVSATLMFRLKTVVEHEKYAVIRSSARVGDIEGQKIVLLDDSGNGRFNDAGKDAVLLGDAPVAMLGKHMLIGENFYEVLVQEAGLTLEYRPAKLEFGWVDLLEKFKPPQKSETLRIHTLIIDGPLGSFSCSPQRRNVKVPVGAYDLVFGLFERAKETVYMKKGEKTTFTVSAQKVSTPQYGGEVKAQYEVSFDGKDVIIDAPTFYGELGERYFPESYKVIPLSGSIAQVYEDKRKLEYRNVFGTRRFDLLPNGQPEPLKFRPFRNHADEYEATVTYNSGILGSVLGRHSYQYVPRPVKKKPSE